MEELVTLRAVERQPKAVLHVGDELDLALETRLDDVRRLHLRQLSQFRGAGRGNHARLLRSQELNRASLAHPANCVGELLDVVGREMMAQLHERREMELSGLDSPSERRKALHETSSGQTQIRGS